MANSNNTKIQQRNKILGDYYAANRRKLILKVSGRAATPQNAEDIVHNAFVRALQYWDNFNPEQKELGAWFGVILNNSLRDFMKDERAYGTTEEFNEELHEGVKMTNLTDDLLKKIRRDIGTKSKQTAEVLNLYFVQHYTPEDIITILDIKWEATRQIIKRFKSEICEKYGDVL